MTLDVTTDADGKRWIRTTDGRRWPADAKDGDACTQTDGIYWLVRGQWVHNSPRTPGMITFHDPQTNTFIRYDHLGGVAQITRYDHTFSVPMSALLMFVAAIKRDQQRQALEQANTFALLDIGGDPDLSRAYSSPAPGQNPLVFPPPKLQR